MSILKNKYGELRSGWSITCVLLVLIVGQLAGAFLVFSLGEDGLTVKTVITLIYGLITVAGSILLFKLMYKRRIHQMGLEPKGWFFGFLYGFGLGAVSIATVFLILILTGQAEVISVQTRRLFSATIIVEFFSVCIFMFSEELITRGYMMTALKTTRNKWVIFFFSTFLFTILHLMTPGFTVLSIANTFLVGSLFAFLFIKTGKIWMSAGFHIAWNFFEGDIFGLMVSGNEQAAIFLTKTGSNELLTGGTAGPEGGVLTTAVLLLAFLYVHYLVKAPATPAWTFESDLPFTDTFSKS